MTRHTFTALLATALTALAAGLMTVPAAGAAGEQTARIIGGTKVSPADRTARWSGIVSIQSVGAKSMKEGHSCGGVAIAPRYVLTARHCVESPPYVVGPEDIAVVGQTTLLNATRPLKRLQGSVKRIERSPVAAKAFMNQGADIAIIETHGPVTGAPMAYARPEHVAWWGGAEGRAEGVRVAGWGVMRDGSVKLEREFGPGVGELREVPMALVPQAECAAAVVTDKERPSTAHYLCASNRAVASGKPASGCFGDSGGPVIASDPAGVEPDRVVGIVSHGLGIECTATPSQHVIVANHATWIGEVMESWDHTRPVPRIARVGTRKARVSIRDRQYQQGTYRIYLRYGDGQWWTFWKQFTGASTVMQLPPRSSRSGVLRVRVLPASLDDGYTSGRTLNVRTWVDAKPPRKITGFSARRVGKRHVLKWRTPRDRGDRVVGVLVETRKVGNKRWTYEAFYDCGACWTRAKAKHERGGTHVMLPGRREFRVAAVDRAGNWGPWSVARERR